MGPNQPDNLTASPATIGSAALRILLSLLAACAVIWLEPVLGQLATDRPGIVPVALLALIAGLISPGSRRWLVVTLCFGVGMLALRDAFRALHLPTDLPVGFQGDGWVRAYAACWVLLAALACAAGVGEAVQPGVVWARRFYFLVAALYFTGHGVLIFLKEPTWQSPVLVMIGAVALVGAWMADRVIDPEPEEEPLEDDLQAIADRSTEMATTLRHREWVEKS